MVFLLNLRNLFVCLLLVLGACSSSSPEGKPLPDMTFKHVEPIIVRVSSVDIENRYDSAADLKDVSSSFPVPPDIALRRYAENRIKAAGFDEAGTLKFVIEDVHIYQSMVQPAGKFSGWLGVKRKDLYEVAMKIRLYIVADDGAEGIHSILNMRRSIAIPQSYSLAEKEQEKFKFLEMLMSDVDEAVIKTLGEKMELTSPEAR